jgi:hypothetical protein
VVGAAFVLVLAPWIGRNYAEFGGLTLSNNSGVTMLGTYCEAPFEADPLGGWDAQCFCDTGSKIFESPPPGGTWDEYEMSRAWQELAVEFAWAHRSELPAVALAKIGRTWGFYAPEVQYDFDVLEFRDPTWQRVGQILNFVLLALAVLGAVLLPRSWWRRWSLVLALPVLVTITAAVFLGTTRTRVGAEPAIALFATAGVVLAIERLRGRRRPVASPA